MTAPVFLMELAMINGIEDNLPVSYSDVIVAADIEPGAGPDRYVRVQRIGGTEQYSGVRDRVRCLIECWATTKPAAALLAERVHREVTSLRGKWVRVIDEDENEVELWVTNSGADLKPVFHADDSRKKRYQFQGWIDVSLRART